MKIYLIGHKSDKTEIELLQRYLTNKQNILIGDYEQLHDTAQLLSKSKLLISPDTSVIHIANTLNLKTIVLANNYDRGFHLSEKIKNFEIIRKDTMDDILPSMIVTKVDEILTSLRS